MTREPYRGGHRAHFAAFDLGNEAPLYADSGRAPDRRSVNLRWLVGTLLVALTGTALMGVVVRSSRGRRHSVVRAQFAPPIAAEGGDGDTAVNRPLKRDKVQMEVEATTAHQIIQVSTSTQVGDHAVIRMKPFSRVIASLALQHGGDAARVPPFDPAGPAAEGDGPKLPPTSGPEPDDGEVSVKTEALAHLTVVWNEKLALSLDQVRALAEDADHPAGQLPAAGLPPQFQAFKPAAKGGTSAGLAYAEAEPARDSALAVRFVPENVTDVGKTPPALITSAEDQMVPVNAGDTLAALLQKLGSTPDLAQSATKVLGEAGTLKEGQRVKVSLAAREPGEPRQPVRISVYTADQLDGTAALSDAGSFVSVASASAEESDEDQDDDADTINLYQSIYETALKQKVPPPIIDKLERICAHNVDLTKPARSGDNFEIFYQDEGEEEGSAIRYAALNIDGQQSRYYWFKAPGDDDGDFFDQDGRSVQRFLMRRPISGGRISSPFGYRTHPIFGVAKLHTGVDIADKLGTPIRATGDGEVIRVTTTGGYGRHVEIQHINGYVTTYSHMGGFGPGIKEGAKVHMGEVVGFIGMTGFSTGPHVHYEVKINGSFVDPMRIRLPEARELDTAALGQFSQTRHEIDAMMNRTATGLVAPTRGQM